MSKSMTQTVNMLYDLIKRDKKRGYDTTATITRVEDGVAWIHIPGGVDETPAKLTINAKAGDTVQARVANGRAFLVGNASAPPTDNTVANQAVERIVKTAKAVEFVQKAVEVVTRIAGNTAQYFWMTETGTDTGAHITEIPQDEFLADPENGGGNLLARSNGVAVRDGLTELATFGASGVAIGQRSVCAAEVDANGLSLYEDGGLTFRMKSYVSGDFTLGYLPAQRSFSLAARGFVFTDDQGEILRIYGNGNINTRGDSLTVTNSAYVTSGTLPLYRNGNMCTVAGSIGVSAVGSSWTTIGTIPAGYRPVARMYINDTGGNVYQLLATGELQGRNLTAGTKYFGFCYVCG